MARSPRKRRDPNADRLKFILDERTQALARRAPDRLVGTGGDPAVEPVLVCMVGRERYGIPLAAVQSVIPFSPPIPMPRATRSDLGLVGRNGVVYVAFDLSAMMKAAADDTATDANQSHLLLLRRDSPRIALRVDRALDIATSFVLDPQAKAAPSGVVLGHARDVRSSGRATDAGFALLDLNALLDPATVSSPSVRSAL